MDAELERMITSAYAAFARCDVGRMPDFFHEEVLYVNPPYAMEAGTRQGHEALVDVWQKMHALFEYDAVDLEGLTEAPGGGAVVAAVRYRGRGRASGAPIDVPQWHALELEDGRVRRFAWYGSREEAAAAAGLA